MPAVVTRLRIAGFKSFAEPTTIEILPGLTGIVGPNGCGKSNVVEALRWAMGETSARSLRGGEMDEVIFAGSAARPQRDIAEVVVTLDDAAGLAPAPLTGEIELQVSRQIERGAGSSYRVNDRPMRARDVQTMFADMASGARSSAMVSQGRVAALVDARPDERRSVLEEAAGITGLHARRQEADTRLRAAEINLGRVADLRSGLAGQHTALARQAEAALVYRTAVDALAAAQARLLGVLSGRAGRALVDAVRAVGLARDRLAAAERTAAAAAAQERTTDTLVERSRTEASRVAMLVERARAAFSSQQGEAARAIEALARAERWLSEVTVDDAVAARQCDEAETALSGLRREAEALGRVLDGIDGRREAAEATLETARAATRRQAELSGARLAAGQELDAAEVAWRAAAERLALLEQALAEATASLPDETAVRAADEAQEAAAVERSRSEGALEAASEAMRQASEVWAIVRRDAAAHEDVSLRAAVRQGDAQARRDRIGAEAAAVAARRSAALAARLAPGSVERADAAAAAAREAVEQAADVLDVAERGRGQAAKTATRARAAIEIARERAREATMALEQVAGERAALEERHGGLVRGLADARGELVEERVLRAAEDAAAASAGELEAARARADVAERGREAAMARGAEIREAIAARRAEIGAAEAEIGALSALASDAPSLLDLMAVPEHAERAVAAALGDGLAASLDPSAARHWVSLGPMSECADLPGGVEPMAHVLAAPAALARALSQIGLLDAADDGLALQTTLRPGQMLVTRDGSFFRWDGHVSRGDQPSPVVERMRARRRLLVCEVARSEACAALPDLEAAVGEATARARGHERALADAREAMRSGERAAAETAARVAAVAGRQVAARARADGVAAELARIGAALGEVLAREGAILERAAVRGRLEELSRIADEAASEAGQAARAEQRAREALRAAEAMQIEMETESLRLVAREAETCAMLASLEPVMVRLTDELAQAETELEGAQAERTAATTAIGGSAERLAAAEADVEATRGSATRCRMAWDEARTRADATGAAQAVLIERRREAEALRSIVGPQRDAMARELGACVERLLEARQVRTALGEETGELETARHAEDDGQFRLASLLAEAGQGRLRLHAIAGELPSAVRRHEVAAVRMAELRERLGRAQLAWDAVQDAPAAASARLESAGAALAAAKAEHALGMERAAAAQAASAAIREERRAAELALGAALETVHRAEASESATRADAAAIEARIREDGRPVEVVAEATAAAEAEARRGVGRALKARDEIGPVNLLAERELDEIGQRLAALDAEASELEEALARLRSSIGHLNKEGRERLSASFVQIDAQFRSLFGRMFDGGRAHLALVGSDDPLEAGLEIYAQPPGKKLSTLSLLSGGEQALTALSLIFAAFRCNPAPVCVLDEVDAPLDDANVERFCRLVSDMAKETGTRFLVVTHHQVTMASMDRLYGVTMQERGVSRLLSVDLGHAVTMTAV